MSQQQQLQLTAASSIAEHLSSPPTLTRIPLLRQRIQKERASLEQSLTARAKDQVDSVREGLQGLREARNAIEGVKEGMKEIEQTMGDPTAKIVGFDKLVELSIIHRRFVQALEMVSSLRGMYSRLSYISDLLSSDRASPLGPSPNLLPVHYHLSELETFRNETLAQAKRHGDSTSKATLEQYFERLGSTIADFEEHYFHLASNLLELARKGNARVAVKIAKIAEVEGARDQKAIAIRMVKKSGNVDVAARFRSLQADARTIKHYRSKVVDAIRESCKAAVERSFQKYGEDIVAWLDDIDWLYDDLQVVVEELAPCFPPDWNIHNIYVKAYHKALYDFLALFITTSPGASALLRVAQFPKEYKSTLTKSHGVPAALLQPPLLDGKEEELIEDYVKLLVSKMDEWSGTLMKTEMEAFVVRADAPESDDKEHFHTQGVVILFQMLNQQLELALDSNQGSILVRIVGEANRVLRAVQAQWSRVLASEFTKFADKKQEVVPGFVEYVMALANDMVTSARNTEAINNRLEPLVSSKYAVPIRDHLSEAQDGFLEVAKECVQILIDSVFSDLLPATKSLLTSTWYTEDPMEQITLTLNEYMDDDYRPHLDEELWHLLVEDIVDKFILTYLTAIRRCTKLRIPLAIERIRADIDKAIDLFVKFKPGAGLRDDFQVLEDVLTLIAASKMMAFLEYWPFRKAWGTNVPFVEGIMKARDDFDRSAVSDIMDAIRRKVDSEVDAPEDPPNILSRVPR